MSSHVHHPYHSLPWLERLSVQRLRLGDPLHLSYVMAWDAHQLVRRPTALFQSNSFHPYPRSLAFADHLRRAVTEGRLPADRVREAFLRVQRFKRVDRWAGC